MENITFSRVEDILAKSAMEADQRRAEADQRRAEADKEMKALRELMDRVGVRIDGLAVSHAATEKLISDVGVRIDGLAVSQIKTEKLISALGKQIGGMSNNMGAATTEYFFNTFNEGNKKMFGEEFDDIFKEEKRKTKKGFEDEYDILMFNGQAVCVVEVKYKADTDDVIQVLRKEKTFRENFPEHNNKKLYLAMASMSFHWRTEQACEEHGIAIIKQVGDKVIIKDKHIKAF